LMPRATASAMVTLSPHDPRHGPAAFWIATNG
jgi:hypothetical protein